jgi:ubiquinone/menaquinone biosynthesis C-methylase UbiE
MSERFKPDQIRDFWQQQAVQHGQSPAASWSDFNVIEMEIKEISKYLDDNQSVLDVGCANGYSTVHFAAHKRVQIRGIDYIPEMIEQAKARLQGIQRDLAGSVEFDVGDITALKEQTNAYDRVIVIRVVINLGDWNTQLKGLHECARVLKPGGLLLLSEATVQGWKRLNTFRREWGLGEIPMPPFNLYLDQDQVHQAVAPQLELVELLDFASTYYVGTRVLKPLLDQALGGRVNVADPSMDWNRWFSHLPAWGDYGTQKLFVFRKNSVPDTI